METSAKTAVIVAVIIGYYYCCKLPDRSFRPAWPQCPGRCPARLKTVNRRGRWSARRVGCGDCNKSTAIIVEIGVGVEGKLLKKKKARCLGADFTTIIKRGTTEIRCSRPRLRRVKGFWTQPLFSGRNSQWRNRSIVRGIYPFCAGFSGCRRRSGRWTSELAALSSSDGGFGACSDASALLSAFVARTARLRSEFAEFSVCGWTLNKHKIIIFIKVINNLFRIIL